MGKVVVSQFVTVDGVAEDPGGSEKTAFGGWAFKFPRGDEGDRFKLDEAMASDALLLGRVTFEGFAAAWPSQSGDFADKFNDMPKYVVSATLTDPAWRNSTVVDPDGLWRTVKRLKDELSGDILVNGSLQLVAGLAALDLVDEYRLMVYPTVLGAGKQLFTGNKTPRDLRLAGVDPAGETVILTYQRAG